MPLLKRALLGAPLAVLAASAAAQDRTIVVTAERLAEEEAREVEATPGGADLVAAEEFENKAAVSLRDALAFSPGVYAQPRFGQEVRLSVRGSGISRGFHMRGLTLLQDGIPINLADNNGDFQELDPLVLQYLSVYRGSNALRFGSSTLGGAINGVTPTGRSSPGLHARIDGGSFGTLRGLVSGGFANELADAWVALTGDTSSGDRDHADRRSLRFHGNVGLRLTEGAETRFYASAQHIRQDLPGALTLQQALEQPQMAAPGSVTGDQARDIESLRLQNRTTFQVAEDGTLDVGVFLNAKELFHPIFQVIDQKSTDWGVYSRFDLARPRFELTLGGTTRWGTIQARQYVNRSGGRNGGPRSADAEQDARTVDLYGEVRVAPFPGFWLIAGTVYVDGRRTLDNRLNAAASDEASYHEFLPKLGILFEPAKDLALYANYSRSAELPGFSELAQPQTPPAPGFTPLVPQTAWTAEIGTRGRVGIASWDLALYRSEIEGELLQYSPAPGTIPAATFNAERTVHQGIEAALDLALTPWLRLRQVYNLSHFRFVDDVQFGDNRLPVIPEHFYRAELRIGSDTRHIAPSVEWVPEGAWADYANTLQVDGYLLLGLTAEAELREGLSLFFDARNLTEERAVGDVGAVVRVTNVATQALFYPVERRALYGGVRARF